MAHNYFVKLTTFKKRLDIEMTFVRDLIAALMSKIINPLHKIKFPTQKKKNALLLM